MCMRCRPALPRCSIRLCLHALLRSNLVRRESECVLHRSVVDEIQIGMVVWYRICKTQVAAKRDRKIYRFSGFKIRRYQRRY